MLCRNTGHIEKGMWYSIHGNNTALLDVPPQIFFVRRISQDGRLGRPYVIGAHLTRLGNVIKTAHNVTMFLDTVGVYDGSSGMLELLKTWKMKEHGRYLVKHETVNDAWKALWRDYREVEEALCLTT